MGSSTSAFLTNSVVAAAEPTKATITITTASDPIISSQDYTNVDEQYIQGDSLSGSQSNVTGNWNVNGIITTDGQDVGIKFNKLQFDIAEPDNRNSYPNHVIEAVRNGETITMAGKELVINATQKNYNGTNSASEKSFSSRRCHFRYRNARQYQRAGLFSHYLLCLRYFLPAYLLPQSQPLPDFRNTAHFLAGPLPEHGSPGN